MPPDDRCRRKCEYIISPARAIPPLCLKSAAEEQKREKNHMKTPRATKLLALFLAFVSSVSSGASGAKQMINAGKQSIKRITSALKTNGVSAAVTEGKKLVDIIINQQSE